MSNTATAEAEATTRRVRVKIIGAHPHTGEYGTIVEENGRLMSAKLAGIEVPMWHVALDDCPHGTDACYAAAIHFKIVPDKVPKKGARR